MKRALLHLLIAAALVLAQQGTQLHALSHLRQDLIRAVCGGECTPPASHPATLCLAFHALDNALPGVAPAAEPPKIPLPPAALVALPVPFPPRIPFASRAPPTHT